MPVTRMPRRAAVSAKPPQPQPISRMRVALLGAELVEDALVLGGLRRFERLVPRAVDTAPRSRSSSDRATGRRTRCRDRSGRGCCASSPSRELSRRRCSSFSSRSWNGLVCAIAAQRLLVLGEQRDQPRQVGRIAEAFHVGFGEADVAVEQDAAEEAPVLDLDVGRRRAHPALPKTRDRTVRQPHGQAADGRADRGP